MQNTFQLSIDDQSRFVAPTQTLRTTQLVKTVIAFCIFLFTAKPKPSDLKYSVKGGLEMR